MKICSFINKLFFFQSLFSMSMFYNISSNGNPFLISVLLVMLFSELIYDFLVVLSKRLTEVDVSTILTVLQSKHFWISATCFYLHGPGFYNLLHFVSFFFVKKKKNIVWDMLNLTPTTRFLFCALSKL